jgi:flavin reductase (DIM6/NTAB) family NADH-FMN oxidoreductase RutF
MTFDARAFRNALGCFPTGVAVVTSLTEDGAPLGVTISSFTSVSLTPPLILFCLDDKNSWVSAFRQTGYFAVNVLSDQQQDLSQRFASRADRRWDDVAFDRWQSGVPILSDCLANLECRISAIHDGGDHRVFVGEVLRLASRTDGTPLVYWRGAYAELSDGAA